ncbi:hypothetical protein TeGR_g9921 [Tetraparma gracilis]|uniref:Uncharacterized protein n=1 Tax=Tetraparma gracilis TaxID=2962635 RepID=A0ABQ6M7Y2_9STRA|nr:hypothetical protein TeGR_g9921 [Tetraparma gracilis]
MLLIANFAGQNVLLFTVEGDFVDVFATTSGPLDVILLDNTDTVAVSGFGNLERIHFFSVDDYEQRGTLHYQESGDTDFVEMPAGAGKPLSMYTVSIFHSRTNPQLLGGIQHVLTILPAATDLDSCAVDFPSGKSIVAGSSFDAVVIPFDEFENPTSHAEDAFESRVELGSSRENVGNRHVLTADHAFSEVQTIAGTYKLYLYRAGTVEQVAGSPISFDVVPAAPSADTSTASSGNATSIVSAFDTPLPLQAFLRDQYGNEVLDAPGVVVRVQGLDPVDPAAIVEHVLEGPRYSHTLTVPADTETALVISFHLDDVQIGETAEIAVAPPPLVDNTTTYIAVGCSLGAILLLGAAAFYQQQSQMNKKRKLERVEREKELKLSMDEKLVKAYTTKMQKQRVYFGLEVGDVASDLFKPIFMAATFKAGREWFLALVVAVGLLALVQAYISIPVRRKMLKHYQGIIDGDMLHIYAKAEFGKKEEGGGEGTVGEENLKVSTGINGGGCERS